MKKTICAFGEVMLRLAPMEKKRFFQVLPGALDATFGGGEANVCASLAMLGASSCYLTALPDNPISRCFAMQLRGIGVKAHATFPLPAVTPQDDEKLLAILKAEALV